MTNEIDTNKILTDATKLQQSLTVAEMVKLSDELDLEVVDEMLRDENRYHAIEPIMDPTRYRAEHAGMEATFATLRAARDLAKVVRASREKNGQPPRHKRYSK